MKATEVAKHAGLGVHAVRFYVRAGLVVPRRNPSNNYKQFREHDVARLRFIKGVQTLGFSLREIGSFLDGLDAGECACNEIHQQLAGKIGETRELMEELSQRYAVMQKVYESWNQTTGHYADIGALCRLLEQPASNRPRTEVKLNTMPRSRKPQALASSRRRAPRDLTSASSVEGEHQSVVSRIGQMLNTRWASA